MNICNNSLIFVKQLFFISELIFLNKKSGCVIFMVSDWRLAKRFVWLLWS